MLEDSISPKNIAIFTAPMLLLLYFSAIQNDYIVFAIPNILANDTITPLPPTNQPPIPNAGENQIVNAGDLVTLDGSDSIDPDGRITSYSWMQTDGPSVTMNNSNVPSPLFTAPSVPSDATLKFSLTVKDDKGATSTPTTTSVTVKAPTPAQSITPSIPNQTISGNATSIAACPSNQTKGFSSDEYVFVTKWGCRGQGDGQFDTPSDVETDSLGNVYVVDMLNNRIQKFDSNGNFITKWGSYGTGDGQFVGPVGVATDSSDYVYVSNSDTMSDIDTMEIQKFDSNGNFITKWGSNGTGDGQFYLPGGIAVDSLDNVYVAEYGNNRIQKFDSSGNFITKWGSTGNGDGQFNGPVGMAVDSSNNVYVTERNNGRVQKFDGDGNFITKWGSPGTGNGQFCSPDGIAVDSSSNVYVAECIQVQKFDSSGNFITKWGSEGAGDGQFSYYVRGIALDASGKVYVADQGNNRIQVFAPSS